MSREAVYETLAESIGLNSLGLDRNRIFPNWSLEERPIPTGPFIILRWGTMNDTRWQTVKEPVSLMIWVHYPVEVTDDFSLLDHILDACDEPLREMWDVVGADGYTVSQVRIGARSGDFKDAGFQTITKSGTYRVLARIT